MIVPNVAEPPGGAPTSQTGPIDDLLESVARHDQGSVSLEVLADALEREFAPAWCVVGVAGEDRPQLFHTDRLPDDALAVVRLYDARRLFSPSPGTLQVVDAPGLPNDERLFGVMAAAGMESAWLLTVSKPSLSSVSAGLVLFRPDRKTPTVADLVTLRRYQNLTAVVVERMVRDEQIHYEARHDKVTGLPNRDSMIERIETSLHRPGPSSLAVLYVDLDRFASLNESLGRRAGDDVLRVVAGRIRSTVRPTDAVARLDGDAFGVMCELIRSPVTAEHLARRVAQRLAEPIDVASSSVVVTASVGVVFQSTPEGADQPGASPETASAEELLQRAVSAIGHVEGGGRIAVYREDLRSRAAVELKLESELRRASEDGQLAVGYQPQVRASDRRVVGVEALLRWSFEDRPVSPDVFVPIAERSGLIEPIGRWVFARAAADLARWELDVPGLDLTVTVNLSGRQLADPGFEAWVAEVLADTGVEASRLSLEITESALVDDPDAASALLHRLKALGLGVAIDDFGTAYASLDYLRRFSMADTLKIDRTFVDGVAQPGTNDAAIVAATLSLGRSLGMVTVAEGVETAAQAAVLTELGCDRLQGNLFGRAVPASDVPGLVIATSRIPSMDRRPTGSCDTAGDGAA